MSSAIISNLIARLTLDSRQFDGATKASRKSLRAMVADMHGSVRGLTGIASAAGKLGLAAAAVYALGRATKALVGPAIEAERSETNLAAALRIRGQYAETMISVLREHAEALADGTRYSHGLIEEQMALALTMGAGTQDLRGMTEAAIGLSAAYRKDLAGSMRVIALARQGETGQLKEMGIALDRTKPKREQFYELLGKGRAQYARAAEDSRTLGGSIEQLRNEWAETRESLARPFVPALTHVLRTARETLDTIRDITTAAGPGPDLYAKAAEEYRQITGDFGAFQVTPQIGGGEAPNAPKYQQKWSQIWQTYRRQWEQERKALVADGTPSFEPDLTQVRRLNDEMRDRIAIERELAAGNQSAAEMVRYRQAAEDTWGETAKETTGALVKYSSALETLNSLRSARLAAEYITRLEDEQAALQLVRRGYEDEAEALRVVNEMTRENVDLSEDQRRQIEELVIANRRLALGYGDSFSEGALAGIRQMSREMERLGDLGANITRTWRDGMVDATTDALLQIRSLNDALRSLLADLTRMGTRHVVNQLYTSLFSAVAGSFGGGAGNPYDPGPGLGASVGRCGGIVGESTFPQRVLPAALFARAPRARYGLEPDGYPFVLHRGERVQTAAEVQRERSRQPTRVEVHVHQEASAPVDVYGGEIRYEAERAVAEIFIKDRLRRSGVTIR